MGDFQRPRDSWRFRFRGMKLNARPDALPPDKYPVAINVREYEEGTIRCRPGLVQLPPTGIFQPNVNSTDLRAYTALQTDNLPRILGRNTDDSIWLDNSTPVGSLAGGGATLGATLIPFRPNESPNPYMYIANGKDYQKFSAPSGTTVVQQKVGIAEPQAAVEAALLNHKSFTLEAAAGGWTNGGTAGVVTNGSRFLDTVGTVLADPNGGVQSASVTSAASYQQRMMVFDTVPVPHLVTDVLPSLIFSYTVAAIYYFAGATGHCIVVPSRLAADLNIDESIYTANILINLRRGSLISIGGETVYVWSVTRGPDGTISIETSTTLTHAAGAAITGVPAIQMLIADGAISGAIGGNSLLFQVTSGVGTIFTSFVPLGFFNSSSPDDYITLGINIDNLENLNEIKFLIDVSDGTFTKDFYYYTIRPSDISAAVANAVTQLSAAQTIDQRATIDEESAAASGNQLQTYSSAQLDPGSAVWCQIVFSISQLTRVGSDASKNLQTPKAIQWLVNASGTVNVMLDQALVTFGTFAPDVGDIGAPYRYRVRPRSKNTGVVGNPSPDMRYGVNPRRESVLLNLPSAAYDAQIDTWDIFRYGGTITSWRFIGSVPSSTLTFRDIYDDSAAEAGDELDFDNFEPWPSVDVPNFGTATQVVGTVAVVSTTDTDILQYLPGTLIRFGGQNFYTFRQRPMFISGTSYLIQLIENAGNGTNLPYLIQEPFLANQHLPYMWGPDANGVIFACGDQFRPGTLYFAKPYAPDSAPDTFNQEISSPTEPLLGGEVLDGVPYVASSLYWWRLYFQPDNPSQRYSAVKEPIPRGLAAPFGHCNDGSAIYWWAKDGIWSTAQGSLTDADLYDLFPHEGVKGQSVTYNGITVQAPDYSQAAKFRLAYANGYLYAIYVNNIGTYQMLVLNVRTGAWSADSYGGTQSIFSVYQIEQPPASTGVLNPVVLLAGTTGPGFAEGRIYIQTDLVDDPNSTPIACTLATFEFDGGDLRAPKQWGDYFLDLVPAAPAGVVTKAMSLGAGVAPTNTVPSGTVRTRIPLSVGGVIVSDFLGLFLQWSDDFTVQSTPTQLFAWQPSFDIQPAKTIAWSTFGTSFGMQGYGHIRQIAIAWVSLQPITLTIASFDGQSPLPITIPSSGGSYQKQMFPVSANKGQLFFFQATSPATFQIFENDIEIHVGPWARTGAYEIFRNFGGQPTAQATI
jgi:hypothetical protein